MKNLISESQLSSIIHEYLKPRLDDFKYNQPGVLRHVDEVELIADFLIGLAQQFKSDQKVDEIGDDNHFDVSEEECKSSLEVILGVATLKAKLNNQNFLTLENFRDSIELLGSKSKPFSE